MNEKSEKLKIKAVSFSQAMLEKKQKEKDNLENLQKALLDKQLKAEMLREGQLKSKVKRCVQLSLCF
jgi:hypothetical protein